MKKIIGAIVFCFFSAAAFSQSFSTASYHINTTQTVRTETFSLYHNTFATAMLYETTFSKSHVLHPTSAYNNPNRTFLGSILWGGLAGAGLGASAVLVDAYPGYHPKSKDVLTFSALGAGAGVVVGLITGIVRAAK
jgi:hypothetical protein